MSDSDYPLDDVQNYDEEAEAIGWIGPELAFAMIWPQLSPGQRVLDIGVGTGLAAAQFHKAGLKVHGMDLSEKMLEISSGKGVLVDAKKHDLTVAPYPYDEGSMDHAVCVGTLNFFEDLSTVFNEVGRVLRPEGCFAFITGHREEDGDAVFSVGPEHTRSGASVTMYLHSEAQVRAWLEAAGLRQTQTMEFKVPMDKERKWVLPARATMARKEPA